MCLIFFIDKSISSKPSSRHFFLNSSNVNLIILFPKYISCFSKFISISFCLIEYSESSTTLSSEIFTGKIPFLKQLL